MYNNEVNVMSKKIVTSFRDIGKARHVLLTLPVSGVDDDGNECEPITYKVRGGTPHETRMIMRIAGLPDAPEPPTKKRVRMPLDGNRIDAANLGLHEDYLDYDDATYKHELEIYTDEMRLAEQRAVMYRLMACVQGFDMTDEDIAEVLGEPAHPKEPLEELALRLDQLSEIIMPDMDNNHFLMLARKITELSGVSTEQVNFT